MSEDRQEIQIRRWSNVVANACLGSALILPVLVMIGLYSSDNELPLWVGTFGVLPVILFSMSMVSAYRCFGAFAQGSWFSQHPAGHLRKSGMWLVWANLAGIFVPILIGALISEGSVAFSFNSYQFQGLLFGGIIWVLGSVWQDAYLIAKENAEFV